MCLFTCLAKRTSLLQRGKLDVVKALNDLPKTKHLASSFVVDVSRATVCVLISDHECVESLLITSSRPLLFSLCGVYLLKLAVVLAIKPRSGLSHVCLLLHQLREGK